MTDHLRNTCLAVLLLSITIGHARAQSRLVAPASSKPVATQPVTLDLPSAAKQLTDFANWCVANKARSAGEAALVLARRIVDVPEGAEAIRFALKSTPDDASYTPAAAAARQVAVDKAAEILEAMAMLPHDAAEDGLHDSYLLKAVQISSKVSVSKAQAAVGRAINATKPDALLDWYAILLQRDAKWAALLESNSIAKSVLPEAARKAVIEFLASDRGYDALAYLQRLTKVDPKGFAAGAYQTCTDVLATKVFLVRSPDHPMAAYVSIPWKWNPSKTSPVIFCFAGAGKEYRGVCDDFHAATGDGPFVTISPVTLTNTNSVSVEAYRAWYADDNIKPYVSGQLSGPVINKRLEFDLPGITALYKSMRSAANLESRMYITGFSGGGIPCYAMLIRHPDLIAAAAPACANYYLALSANGTARGTPVQQFFGEKDGYNAAIGNGPGLFQQGREATGVLLGMGYDVAEPTMVRDTGHSDMSTHVVRFFNGARTRVRKNIGP